MTKTRPAHRPRSKPTTPFARWLEGTGLTYAQVAKLIGDGCSAQAISNWRRGNTLPGRARANRIAEVSGGKVPVSVWDRKGKTA